MNSKATVFEFTSYEWEPQAKRAVFHYKTEFTDRETILWTETILLPEPPRCPTPEKLLEGLHIMLGISYWKSYCATNIKLPYNLSKGEADFWNTVYKKGLGEFFYKNKLDPKISPKFPHIKTIGDTNLLITHESTNKYLVGIGGGKDSIVSAELLKAGKFDLTSFHIKTGKPSELVDNVIKTIGAPSLKIQRILDPKIYQAHQYNGHIPVSAIYAFLGVFACALYGYDSFIVSNEHSSNFGNITYKGLEVNHQWSKSFEFETLFSDYIKNFTGIKYFSLMRSFYEIRIVKMFAKYPQYFPLFSSCNRNFTAAGNNGKLWCGQCAKCVFAFALLSAFLNKKKLLNIFGKDLSKEESLKPLFKDISGQGSMKPFDCVGTFEEVQEALGIKKHPEVWRTNPQNNIPEEFKFLGMERAYILGFGKEGKVTKQYLKKYYPKLKVGVGDSALDKKYLKKQADFDIAIKTPGIKKELVTIPYTTATNIFFSSIRRRASDNLIIGVTGSKGKSTTTSLIYHILKTAGKNVEIMGNIGIPMLEALLNPKPYTLNPKP